MDPGCDVLIAYMQNGRILQPDHGYPVRMIIPGHIGGRMVKWLDDITVTGVESDNFYHYHDNRVLPSQVDQEKAKLEGGPWLDLLSCMTSICFLGVKAGTPLVFCCSASVSILHSNHAVCNCARSAILKGKSHSNVQHSSGSM